MVQKFSKGTNKVRMSQNPLPLASVSIQSRLLLLLPIESANPLSVPSDNMSSEVACKDRVLERTQFACSFKWLSVHYLKKKCSSKLQRQRLCSELCHNLVKVNSIENILNYNYYILHRSLYYIIQRIDVLQATIVSETVNHSLCQASRRLWR